MTSLTGLDAYRVFWGLKTCSRLGLLVELLTLGRLQVLKKRPSRIPAGALSLEFPPHQNKPQHGPLRVLLGGSYR